MRLHEARTSRRSSRFLGIYARAGAWGRELIAVGLVLLAVLPIAAAFVEIRPEGNFYQAEYAPAVLMACGRGFANVPAGARPAPLARFLNEQSRTVDCDVVRDVPTEEPNDLQKSMRWLLTGAAAIWTVTGHPSWNVLLPINLSLIALSAIAAYGLIRLLARPAVAAPLAAFAVLWPYHLFMLPHLRDYSKGPFIWLGCLGLAVGALGKTLRTRLIAAALGGAAVGFGLGFRADVLVLVPLGVVVLMLQPWQGQRRLWTGPAAVAAFLACFAIAASPILPSYGDGSNNGGIIALEGLSPEIQGRAAVQSDLYLTSYHYNDNYTAGIAAAHARLVQHKPGAYPFAEPPLDAAANEAYAEQARFLPADALLRAVLSAVASLRLGTIPPLGSILIGLPILFAALALLGARRPRALAVALLLGVPLAGVTALQWHERHAFHIALVTFLVIGGFVELWLQFRARDRMTGARFELAPRRALATTAMMLAGLVVAGGIAYVAAAAVQQGHVDRYLAQLERQPRTPVPVPARTSGATSMISLPQRWEQTWDGVPDNRSAFLRVEVTRCAAPAAGLTLRYAKGNPYLDYTQAEQIDARGGATWYVVAPALAGARPAAVELSNAPGCRLRVDQLRPRNLPLLLNVVLDGRTRSGPQRAVPKWAPLLLGTRP